jgi:hypothetical protein
MTPKLLLARVLAKLILLTYVSIFCVSSLSAQDTCVPPDELPVSDAPTNYYDPPVPPPLYEYFPDGIPTEEGALEFQEDLLLFVIDYDFDSYMFGIDQPIWEVFPELDDAWMYSPLSPEDVTDPVDPNDFFPEIFNDLDGM